MEVKEKKALVAELTALGLLVVGGFLFAASLGAGGSRAYPPERTNLCGEMGEWIVVTLWDWFGMYATWGAIALILGTAAALFFKKNLRYPALRAVGLMAFMVALALCDHLRTVKAGAYMGPFVAGGFFGNHYGSLLVLHLRYWGAAIISCVFVVRRCRTPPRRAPAAWSR